jgi:hypothetical protein
MPPDVKITVPACTATMRVQYLSTIVPILGYLPQGEYPGKLPDALRKLQRWWHGRLNALRQAGWSAIQGKKFGYAWNCPPCCVKVEPRNTPCNLPICPFCFARRVEKLYQKVRWLAERERGTVVTYREYSGFLNDQELGIYFDRDGCLRANVHEVLEMEHERPKQFRAAYLDEAIGGYYWYTLSPFTERVSTDGSVGYWSRLHSCVAVMPRNWVSPIEDTVVLKNPRPHRLAAMVGNIFKYRLGWLHSAPFVMAAFLDAVKGTKFLSPFGEFKRAQPDRATDTAGRQA